MAEAAPPPALPVVLAACLVIAADASLDAYTYLDHGRVFAGSQAANVILLALDLIDANPKNNWHHLPAILCFGAGVLLASIMSGPLRRRGIDPRLVCLGADVAVLPLVMLGSDALPDAAVTGALAFLAAMQLTALPDVGGLKFSSIYITSNLRDAIRSAARGWMGERSAGARRQTAVFGLICLAFVAGAAAGGLATVRERYWALLLPLALDGAALLLLRRPGAPA